MTNASDSPPPKPTLGLPIRPGERRHVSVLFSDMVGYTTIIEQLGAETALAFVKGVYSRLTDTVRDHGGSVRGYAGDSVMALFGVPDAQEDAALRACRCALALQQVFNSSQDEFERRYNVRPEIRVGVSSGRVVMASVENDDGPLTAVGSTVNLASRIESLADPGTCLICDRTRRQVQYLTELEFAGEHKIRGMTHEQKLWRLDAAGADASRFDASIARGLNAFVGRASELAVLEDALATSRKTMQWVDIVAEPGLGKTRLVFEFLQSETAKDALVLTGHCTADGQGSPYQPFIEILRKTYGLRSQDDRERLLTKIEAGLESVGRLSELNVALILNALGRRAGSDALAGLDGVLVGLRTRELIIDLLTTETAQRPVLLLIEDVHWIDAPSADILQSLTEDGDRPGLLVLTTRRPTKLPNWLSHDVVIQLALHPMTEDELSDLVRSQLGTSDVPDALLQKLIQGSGGNPLFGEEILQFLGEEGALSVEGSAVAFDTQRDANDVPASMQMLLTARVDRLPTEDRDLLRAAAVIGRRFDPGLLEDVLRESSSAGAMTESLERLVGHDILRREAGRSDYIFKHSLFRETIYQSLVSDARAALHHRVGSVIEQRNEGRLTETAETLAFHFSLSPDAELAFTYNAMAGRKSLGLYSLGEANRYFAAAYALYAKDPACAEDDVFASLMANYALCSNISLQAQALIIMADDVWPTLAKHGDRRTSVYFLHHFVSCLVCAGQYRRALEVSRELGVMATRLGDPVARAYANVSELSVSNYCAPIDSAAYDALADETEALLREFDDAYLRNFFLATLGWNEISRGRVRLALAAADRLLEEGEAESDPRATGYGTAMKALIAMLGDDHARAAELADAALEISRADFDTAIATAARHSASIPLEQPGAMARVTEYVSLCERSGWALFSSGPEVMLGVGMALDGRITEAVAHIEAMIEKREAEGYDTAADWYRLYLCEIYMAVIRGEGDAPLGVMLRNARTLFGIMAKGRARILQLTAKVRANAQYDSEGYYIARCELMEGLLALKRKRKADAVAHLSRAREIVLPSGPSPILDRIDAAISEAGG